MPRFLVLSVLSTILYAIGWIMAIVSVYFLYEGIIEPNFQGHSFLNEDKVQLAVGVIALTVGLLLVAFSELVGVFFAIEKNTRSHDEGTNTLGDAK